jgi:WD40 repeat protein
MVVVTGRTSGNVYVWDVRSMGPQSINPSGGGLKADAVIFQAAMVVAGATSGNVYLWDVRYMTRGPVRQYEQPWYQEGWFREVDCIAIEPRHNTLLTGGSAGIVRWDLQTGASCQDQHILHCLRKFTKLFSFHALKRRMLCS